MDPEVLRDYVRNHGGPAGPGWAEITDKQAKILSGLLKGLFKGSATAEKDSLAYLSYVANAAVVDRVSKATASVLIDLIKSEDPDDWSPSDMARQEAERVLREVYKDQGQIEMFEQEPDEKPAEREPAPEPTPEPPADGQKATTSAQAMPSPVISGKIPEEPKEKRQAAPKAAGKKEFKAIGSSYKKVDPPAQKEPAIDEKPAEPVKDNGEDINILALKRCNPSSWVTAAEMLNKTLETHFTAGQLREAVDKKTDSLFAELTAETWLASIEIAQEAAKK